MHIYYSNRREVDLKNKIYTTGKQFFKSESIEKQNQKYIHQLQQSEYEQNPQQTASFSSNSSFYLSIISYDNDLQFLYNLFSPYAKIKSITRKQKMNKTFIEFYQGQMYASKVANYFGMGVVIQGKGYILGTAGTDQFNTSDTKVQSVKYGNKQYFIKSLNGPSNTIIVRNMPLSPSLFSHMQMFQMHGQIKHISFSKQNGQVIIVYSSVQQGIKAVYNLNHKQMSKGQLQVSFKR